MEVVGVNAVDIGKYLAELRKYYRITQDELAGRMGVTRQAVSKWETGTAIPDIEILMNLSEIYGISINDILKADLTKINFVQHAIFNFSKYLLTPESTSLKFAEQQKGMGDRYDKNSNF